MTDIKNIAKVGAALGAGFLVINCANAIGLKCVIWDCREMDRKRNISIKADISEKFY